MKKILALLIMFFIFSLNVHAELPEFDFSDYTAPDYTYKLLVIYISPLFSLNSTKLTSETGDSESKTIMSNFSTGYNLQIHRKKWETDINIYGMGSYNNFDNDEIDTSNLELTSVLSVKSKYYFSGNCFFTGALHSVYTHYVVYGDDGYHINYFSVTPGAGLGYGRIENVSFMRRALYIIDELYENNILTEYPDKRILVKFGKLLASLDHTRFYDDRLKRIEDFKKINTFLNDHDLLKNDSIEYFTILNDMLVYANVWNRYNGWDVQGAFSYFYRRSSGGADDETLTNNHNYVSLKFNFHKAINRYWQLLFYNRYAHFYYDSNPKYTSNEINSSFEISWYPHSRTNVTGKLYFYYNESDYDEFIFSEKSSILAINPTIQFEYYISPRLRFNAGLYYLYNKETNNYILGDDSTLHEHGLSLSTSYDIF